MYCTAPVPGWFGRPAHNFYVMASSVPWCLPCGYAANSDPEVDSRRALQRRRMEKRTDDASVALPEVEIWYFYEPIVLRSLSGFSRR